LPYSLNWLKEKCGDSKVYGIPKNGLILGLKAGLNLVESPIQAEIVLDDLSDSGKTLKPYIANKRIVVLYVKSHTPDKDKIEYMEEKDGWISFDWEKENDEEDLVVRMLEKIGEDPTREGLLETPKRVLKANKAIFSGYTDKPNLTVFKNESEIDQIVGLSNIEYYSTCEHHMLPFFGKCHVYYIPSDKIVGISKLARIVDLFSRRLQNQERLAKQIADKIEEVLKPKGVAVVMEGQHMCMMARGVAKQHATMKTSELRGVFRDKPEARQELFNLIQ